MAKTIIGKVGITPKGQYSNEVTYVKLDAVHYKGAMYVCLKECTGITPENSEYWFLSAEQGDKPVNGTDYNTEEQKEEFKQAVVADSKGDIDNYTELRKQEISDTTASVVEEVENAGTKQIEIIGEAGTTQVSNVKKAGTEQVSNVETAGSAQIKNIEDTATAKTTEFNKNATVQTNTFNTNAQEKINSYNDNDVAKTTAYNDNATAKTQDFDNNSVEKTNEFNEVVEEKKTEFNENTESYEKRMAELEVENEELAEQMPWATTEQAESIHVEDSARYSRNKLNVFGNLKQETRSGKNLFDYTDIISSYQGLTNTVNEDGSITTIGIPTSNYPYIVRKKDITDKLEDGETYTIYQEKLNKYVYLQMNLTSLSDSSKIYLSLSDKININSFNVDKSKYSYEIVVQTGSMADWGNETQTITNKYMLVKGTEVGEFEKYGAMPSINYPSVPQVITGVQKFRRCGKNLFDKNNATILGAYIGATNNILTAATTYKTTFMKVLANTTYTISKKAGLDFRIGLSSEEVKVGIVLTDTYRNASATSYTIKTKSDTRYIVITYADVGAGEKDKEILDSIQLELGEVATNYEPYNENLYTLDLGDTELCKITDESGNVIAQDKAVYREVDGIWKWQWEKNVTKDFVDDITNRNPLLISSYLADNLIGFVFNGIYLHANLGRIFAIVSDKLKSKFLGSTSDYTDTNSVRNAEGIALNTSSTSQICITLERTRLETEDLAGIESFVKNNNFTCYYPLLNSIYEDCATEQSETLNKLYKLALQKGTNNIINENENGISCEMQLEYMQDRNMKHDNDISELRQAIVALGGVV